MRRVLSGLLVPLFALAGAALMFVGPASAAPALPSQTVCPGYGSGSCTGTGTVNPTPGAGGVTNLQVNAGGFKAGETVDGTVHSTPVSVGSFTASSTGVVATTITLPGGIPAGSHELILVGTVSGVTDTIPFTLAAATAGTTPCAAAYTTHSSNIVLAAAYVDTACATAAPPAAVPSAATPSAAAPQSSSQLPFTGANVATGVTVAAIALAGGGLLVLSSRRRRQGAWEAK